MTRHLFVSALIAASVVATTTCASAGALCQESSPQACCCSSSPAGSGCEMRCADEGAPRARAADISSWQQGKLSLLTLDAGWFADGPAASLDSALRPTTCPNGLLHAPPLKRYLTSCTFRL